jgi:hypothetical protein
MCPWNAAKVLSSVVLLAVATPMSASDKPAASGLVHVRLGGRYDAGTVQRSLDRASGRLERPQCQRVFTDFHDASGRPLQDALDRTGRSGAEHLGTLLFYDGSSQPRCIGTRPLAFTFVGSPIVFVCAQQLAAAARRDPGPRTPPYPRAHPISARTRPQPEITSPQICALPRPTGAGCGW